MARGCFVYQKPEKIRWLDGDKLQAKVGGSKWIGFAIQDFKKMVEEQCDIAEKHLGRLGVPLISPADLEHVQDNDTTSVGHGLWTSNQSLRTKTIGSPHSPKSILDADTSIGVALGIAISYTGGGAMRVPEIVDISVSKVSGGATRSLRFQTAKRRCAIAYDRTKSEGLQGHISFAKTKKTMKFTSERLTCLLLTVAIRFKPHVIAAANSEYGARASLYHGAFLIAEDGQSMSEDRLRYLMNRSIDKHLPGLSINPLRHVTEAISLKAVELVGHTVDQKYKSEMRLTMIALSAHSEGTSDERYAGDQFQIGGISAYHVDRLVAVAARKYIKILTPSYRFFEAAKIFNAYIGLENMQPGTLAQPTEQIDHGALWLWVKEYRPEVAAAAEAQLCGHSARLQLPGCSCPVRMPPHQVQSVQDPANHSSPVAASPNVEQQSSVHAAGVQLVQAHPKNQPVQEAALQTPPSQVHPGSPNVEQQSSLHAAGDQLMRAHPNSQPAQEHPKSQPVQEAALQTPPSKVHTASPNVEQQSSLHASGVQLLQANPNSQPVQEAVLQTPPTQRHSVRRDLATCDELVTRLPSTFSSSLPPSKVACLHNVLSSRFTVQREPSYDRHPKGDFGSLESITWLGRPAIDNTAVRDWQEQLLSPLRRATRHTGNSCTAVRFVAAANCYRPSAEKLYHQGTG